MTTKGQPYPSRIKCRFAGKQGQIVLDQIRAVDKVRVVRKLGRLDSTTQREVLARLGEMFAP
jgi:mRNA interferase MazF